MTIFNIIIIITNRDIHNIIITITEINLSITTTNQKITTIIITIETPTTFKEVRIITIANTMVPHLLEIQIEIPTKISSIGTTNKKNARNK